MMGYKLTIQQKNQIHGVYYGVQFFNCVQDINNDWFLFLSEQDLQDIQNTDFAWILDIELTEFTPKVETSIL